MISRAHVACMMTAAQQGLEYTDAFNEYFVSGDMDAFSLNGSSSGEGGGGAARGGGRGGKVSSKKQGGKRKVGNPLLQYSERSGDHYAVHYASFPPDAFAMDTCYLHQG